MRRSGTWQRTDDVERFGPLRFVAEKTAPRILREFEEKGALLHRETSKGNELIGRLSGGGISDTPQRSLPDRNLPQQFEVAENLARAQHHAAQRVVSDAYRQPRFFPDSPVQVFQ